MDRTCTLPLYEGSVSLKIVDRGPEVTIKPDVGFYLVFGGVDIPIPSDALALFEDLKEADGFGSAMLFHDHETEKALEEAGLVTRTTRGSFRSTALFHDVYEHLCAEARKMYDYEAKTKWEPTEENIAKLPAPIRAYIESLEGRG